MTDANSRLCWGCGGRWFNDDFDHDMEECIEGGLFGFLCDLDIDCDEEEAA